MKKAGVAITREKYIGLAYGELEEPWTAEHEAELPKELQDWSLFKVVRDQIVPATSVMMDYDPDQPREPKGSPFGGQWTSLKSAAAAGQPPLFQELPEQNTPAKEKEIEEVHAAYEQWQQEEEERQEQMSIEEEEAAYEANEQAEIDSDNEYLQELRERTLGEPPPLPQDHQAALIEYTGSTYKDINNHLRFGEDGSHVEDTIAKIDEVFARAKLAEAMEVHRGVDRDVFDEISSLDDGDIFHDQGFVSTSIKEDVADSFGSRSFPIRLPEGYPAIPIGGRSEVPKEREVLLKRGSRFIVRKTGGGTIRLEALL